MSNKYEPNSRVNPAFKGFLDGLMPAVRCYYNGNCEYTKELRAELKKAQADNSKLSELCQAQAGNYQKLQAENERLTTELATAEEGRRISYLEGCKNKDGDSE